MPEDRPFDYVLVGGGLQNALIALAVLDRRPGARIALIEREASVAGNHTWSFHGADVPDSARSYIDPLVVSRWSGYQVRFPTRERRLETSYASISSDSVRDAIATTFSHRDRLLLTDTIATSIDARSVELAGGRTIAGRVVVDARGPGEFRASRSCGYQKFVGLEIELDRPTPESEPTIMDACVPQTDGFRFFYVLPFEPQRVLIEDTYFSDTPLLDVEAVSQEVLEYARRKGLAVRRVLRREQGVLPLPWELPPEPASEGPLRGGVQGGFFHPTTGYSLPAALRLAEHLASVEPEQALGPAFTELVRDQWRQARFAAFLNRLLFTGYAPEQRWRVLARFYGFSDDLVRRFYALRTTSWDRTRILIGRPPAGFSLRRAMSGGAYA